MLHVFLLVTLQASLKIGGGDWSDKFSLDTVGSSGTVQSKTKTRSWEVCALMLLDRFSPSVFIILTARHNSNIIYRTKAFQSLVLHSSLSLSHI